MAADRLYESTETGRLPALSDGVIAIVITLLVLDITVPDLPPGASEAAIVAAVLAQGSQFVGYVLSFLTIGLYWTLHRRAFTYIDRHDRGVVWLNLLFLLLVSFVPFATSVFSTVETQLAVAFYAVVLAATGLALAILWMYAGRRQLVSEGLGSRVVVIDAARYLATPAVFALSAAVATVDTRWAIASWLLLLPINGFLQSRLSEAFEGE
ncbi:TMEM175 family protein [Halobaculum lipolyticum]|uniref:TMEM175 family protein n=1 Tax=Halobaculum lipolyticum TaxID=3032001 RepID=A0ABD5WA51_9EURY|nr:TMEM175 family protein [Halobaculum sp. DT31]